MAKNKVLIIRFSSFGDIVQCSSIVELFDRKFAGDVQIDWVTRKEFVSLVQLNKKLSKVIGFDRKLGIFGLLKLAYFLTKENYSFVYDAHNNVRSKIIVLFLRILSTKTKIITRPKDRLKRILLFWFRKNYFDYPFKGIHSYQRPLKDFLNLKKFTVEVDYDFSNVKLNNKREIGQKEIILVPSAAWEMKRWPLEYWLKLAILLKENSLYILGGKEDTFCEEFEKLNLPKLQNLAGKLSLIESAFLISKADLVISGDTGLLHVADVLKKPGLSLMGPTAFGFTSNDSIKTLEVPLACRPCTKDGSGKCHQQVYKKCLVDLSPELVFEEAKTKLSFAFPTKDD